MTNPLPLAEAVKALREELRENVSPEPPPASAQTLCAYPPSTAYRNNYRHGYADGVRDVATKLDALLSAAPATAAAEGRDELRDALLDCLAEIAAIVGYVPEPKLFDGDALVAAVRRVAWLPQGSAAPASEGTPPEYPEPVHCHRCGTPILDEVLCGDCHDDDAPEPPPPTPTSGKDEPTAASALDDGGCAPGCTYSHHGFHVIDCKPRRRKPADPPAALATETQEATADEGGDSNVSPNSGATVPTGAAHPHNTPTGESQCTCWFGALTKVHLVTTQSDQCAVHGAPASPRSAAREAPPKGVIDIAIEQAGYSPCRSQRGAVVFTNYVGSVVQILGRGHNQKPDGFECDRSDACKATCRQEAVHAEQKALMNAGPHADGADLVHVKVVDGKLVSSGGPSCVQCSKLALSAGITGVWLYHDLGWRRYPANEFHALSLRAAASSSAPAVEKGK